MKKFNADFLNLYKEMVMFSERSSSNKYPKDIQDFYFTIFLEYYKFLKKSGYNIKKNFDDHGCKK